jgi:hypothetical protein
VLEIVSMATGAPWRNAEWIGVVGPPSPDPKCPVGRIYVESSTVVLVGWNADNSRRRHSARGGAAIALGWSALVVHNSNNRTS